MCVGCVFVCWGLSPFANIVNITIVVLPRHNIHGVIVDFVDLLLVA